MSIRPIKSITQSHPTIEGAGVRLRRAFGFGNTGVARFVCGSVTGGSSGSVGIGMSSGSMHFSLYVRNGTWAKIGPNGRWK